MGHRCKRRELILLVTCEREEEPELSPHSSHSEEMIEVQPSSPRPEISLNSVMEITSPKIIKLLGTWDV